jgi:hypothetical protein
MTLEPSADVIDNLRIALKNRKLKLTVVAERLNIPYRSIQNYFAKRSDMPVNTPPPKGGGFGLRLKAGSIGPLGR